MTCRGRLCALAWLPMLLETVAWLLLIVALARPQRVTTHSADERLGLTASLAACLRDARQPGKVTHALVELVQQRVFGIALGYPDANDARALADDPTHGQQELSFFHGYYDTYCYLPLVGTITFNE